MSEGIKESNKRIVIDYLCNYNSMKMRVALIDSEIAEENVKIKTITGAPIAKYGNDVGGGRSELTVVESKSEALMQYEERIAMLTREKNFLTTTLSKLDIVLEYLPQDQRKVLQYKYILRKTWRQVAGELRVHIASCRRIAEKGITAVTVALSNDNTSELYRLYKTEE